MFRLTNQIGCNDVGICRTIRQNQTVGWACDHVDANTAKQHAFCLCNELVTGTDQDIGLGQSEKAECHCGHALDTAHSQNLICATNMRRINNRGCNTYTRTGWRAGNNIVTSRNLGGCHRHDRASDMAITTTWNITSRRVYRDGLLTRDKARHHLGFEI